MTTSPAVARQVAERAPIEGSFEAPATLTLSEAQEALRHEILRRSRAEDALQARTEELSRSKAEMEQFAMAASHDLQAPLRKVRGFCQILSRKYTGQLDEDADVYLGHVIEGARTMQELLDGLLAFSRIGTGGSAGTLVDCRHAAEQALTNLAPGIEQSRAQVSFATPLPVVVGHRALVVLLFQNLLSNSLTFRGGQPPRIVVGAERDDAGWVFSVADNGIGIEAKHAVRVFTVFQRLHTREEYPGTGMGLAICKKIVELMGGRIWFDSTPGEGATFFWTIPHAAPSDGA